MIQLKSAQLVSLLALGAGFLAQASTTGPRLYLANQGIPLLSTGRILSMDPDGQALQTVISGLDHAPDGIVVDREDGFIYFSQMGSAILPDLVHGTIERVRTNGTDRAVIVGGGQTHTPKQLILTRIAGQKKLYWGDREGMRVMRSNVDGSEVQVVVDTSQSGTGSADSKMVVGVAVDSINGWLYWTQKGSASTPEGSLHRAPLDPPPGVTTGQRRDAQVLLHGLPQPIDLDLLPSTQTLYWTERGTTGQGGVNSLVVGNGSTVASQSHYMVQDVGEAIGLVVDESKGRLFFDTVAGQVFSLAMDGSDRVLLREGLGILPAWIWREPSSSRPANRIIYQGSFPHARTSRYEL